MQRTEVRFGILGGLAVCVYKAIEFMTPFQKVRIESHIDTGLFALVIVAAFVIIGIKQKRELGGSLPFLRAFITGAVITVLIAVITIPLIYSYGKFVNRTEADEMIDYINVNLGSSDAPSEREIKSYYAPRNRSMRTGESILMTGFIVSLFSAGMFRKVNTQDHFVKDAELPSMVRKFFVVSIFFALLPFVVYFLWALKWANINTLMFDFISEPITNPLGLQEGTAFLSVVGFILNVVSYNKISTYGHKLNVWNLRMVLLSIASLLISVWLIVH